VTRRRLLAKARQGDQLREGFQNIRDEQGIPVDFPADVRAQAEQIAAAPQPPPTRSGVERRDLRGLPFVTIDPAESMDLDQAVYIERRDSGYRVYYAIADVASFVEPGSALDVETHARGVTMYSPDLRTPLHPKVMSEDVASLFADVDRPAVVWQIDLNSRGQQVEVDVARAMIRSVGKLSYEQVQRSIDDGSADDSLVCLREVGQHRQLLEIERGGIDVLVPDQEIEDDGPGYRLVMRTPLPVEGWNAQISLLTGICAARMMLDAGVGILRTMKAPSDADYEQVRLTAQSLGIDWPHEQPYAELVRGLDPRVPAHAAFLNLVTVLLRSAGYTVLTQAVGNDEPASLRHAAVASAYAHVTAPLRRLVDRYGTECCLAIASGDPVPQWVIDALPALPDEMKRADSRARAMERAQFDLVEAVLMADHVGETYSAIVVERKRDYVVVQLHWPAVRTRVADPTLELGTRVTLELTGVDVDARTVTFRRAS
jgi:VacB/RNase II family 3'-5' exoribonuclease